MKRPRVKSWSGMDDNIPSRIWGGARNPGSAIRARESDGGMAHLVVCGASDGRLSLRAVPLAGRSVVDNGRRLGFRAACDPLKDRLLVRHKLSEPRSCIPNQRTSLGCKIKKEKKAAPFCILRFKSSTHVLASSSESWPPTLVAPGVAAFWISFLSHFCASHLSEALNGGPRGCW